MAAVIRGTIHGDSKRRYAYCVIAFSVALASLTLCAAQVAPESRDSVVDIESAKALESRVIQAHAIAVKASVGLEILDTLVPISGGSGTIISKDGWILTAGHVCGDAGLEVKIHFFDGSTTTGKTAGLHWEGAEDCGLVRFDPTGLDFAVAEVGSLEGVALGEWVIALGHTFGIETSPFRPPVLRLGRVTGLTPHAFVLDAPLSAGDSGGGVFDLDGRLIGINSSAGYEPEVNNATSVDFAVAQLKAMEQGVVTGENAQSDSEDASKGFFPREKDPKPEGTAQRKSDEALLGAIASAVDAASLLTVGVFVDGRAVGFGVVADDEGHIVAKASDVGMTSAKLMIALPDGLTVGGKRVAVDSDLDLVLIATGEPMDAPVFSDGEPPVVGSILVTVGRDGSPAAIGVRSLGEYLPGKSDPTVPYLGIRARPTTPEEQTAHGGNVGVILMAISASSPAGRIGLSVGDFVTRIGGVAVENQPSVGEAIRRHARGAAIDVTRWKDGKEESLRVRLADRPNAQGPSPSTPHYPASRRSSGLGSVIQHDAALRADQMGGPLVNLDGEIVGMNIARADRTKNYALPALVVKGAIVRLLDSARDQTDALPLADPLASGTVIRESAGVIRLNANDAEIIGSTLRFGQYEDAPGALEFWVDVNDSAKWIVEFESAGEYSVRVLQSCDAACAGQDFGVQLGETLLRGATRATADLLDFQPVELGSIRIASPGRASIEVKTGGSLKGPLMNLHAVELKRTQAP